MKLNEIMNNFCTDKLDNAEEEPQTEYKKEILSVYEGRTALGFIAPRHLIFHVTPEQAPGFCVMCPLVNIWEGEYKTKEEAGEALLAYDRRRNNLT